MKSAIQTSFILSLVLITISGCDEVLDQLNLDYESGPFDAEFYIDTAKQGDLVTSLDVVYHDVKQEIEDRGGDLNQLDLVELVSAPITLIAGAQNFNAFESFDVFIKTPLLAEKQIAYLTSVPLDVTELDPILTSDNLKDYMTEGEYTIVLKAVLREDLTKAVELNAAITLKFNL